jgi:hypothetical protein
MFLEQFNVFEQIGIVVAILMASLFFCVILQALSVIYYLILPFRFCLHLICKCECRDKNGEEIDWDDYTLRCPCIGGDDDDDPFDGKF